MEPGHAIDRRAAILATAVELFVARGFAGVSLRHIARVADVDPALVIHYFGSKEGLFLAAMSSVETEPPLSGDIATLGERYIRFVLEAGPQVRQVFLAMLRASDASTVHTELRRQHDTAFVAPLRDRLTGADADLRASLAAALVGGLLYALWVVGDEVLAAAPADDVVRRYGALMQVLIDRETPHQPKGT